MIKILVFVGLGLFLLYVLYDKISWALAKYDEAKRGVLIIARHVKAFRKQIKDLPNKGRLDEIFQDILIQNARAAFVIGGAKLMFEVNDVKAFEDEAPKETEDIVDEESRNLHIV